MVLIGRKGGIRWKWGDDRVISPCIVTPAVRCPKSG